MTKRFAQVLALYVASYTAISLFIIWVYAPLAGSGASWGDRLRGTGFYLRVMFTPGQTEVTDFVFRVAIAITLITTLVATIVLVRRSRKER